MKLAHASDVERANGLERFGVAVVGWAEEEGAGGTDLRGRSGDECAAWPAADETAGARAGAPFEDDGGATAARSQRSRDPGGAAMLDASRWLTASAARRPRVCRGRRGGE